ncbi:helix-turn-helix transcriptional regulator [Paraburkholderia sp. A1RI-2L]|uniref:helix-turn-helix domain-containing protein n=1 Tax=Paraburkholderia sp. A1RI-2L TaxID=3028367 RepID=UPI003B7D5F50
MQRELEDKYNPVPHTKADTDRMMRDPGFKAAYEALAKEFTALDALLTARKEAGLMQAQVAERMGTTTSAVSRLESSLASEKHSPSLATLRKYAAACGKILRISLV